MQLSKGKTDQQGPDKGFKLVSKLSVSLTGVSAGWLRKASSQTL